MPAVQSWPRLARARIVVSSLLFLTAFGAAASPSVNPALRSAAQRDLGLSPTQLDRWLQLEREAPQRAALAQRLLGAHYAGSWIERGDDGAVRLIVASSDPRAAKLGPGVELRQVRYSLAELEAAKARLDAGARLRLPGITRPIDGLYAWHVDQASNSVVVRMAPQALDRAIDFAAYSGADSGVLRLERMDVAPQATSQVYTGVAYQKNGAPSCSVGFAVRQGATKGFVTAGHCGVAGESIWMDGAPIGHIVASEFPVADRAWVAIGDQHEVLPLVTNYAGGFYFVRGSYESYHTSVVCRSGYKTGYQCGFVNAKNVTVNVGGNGPVYGLTQTTACAGFGDSGGGWIDVGEQAQGVTSASNIPAGSPHNCGMFGAMTWFQPVNPILEQYGLTLVTL
ncbi:S1 family peptidase [Lysobacter enzymogenes]|uniref:Lytic endopeptidase preproenzyme n=1 Tax=Lysobacter enzymogenes TaxID=69 RepID=A0AAU9AIT7_LYSEN|nr:S1 family peptidase [Lysobacter enzymogenes]BAV97678.1 lytic endopeptidase preproenzyme [Lysobacter enzymogenes]